MNRLRVVLAAAAAGAAVMASAPAASAHPFGEPQSASVSSTTTGVRVEWTAASDDVTALAAFLGVVGGSHIVVFEEGAYDAEQSSVPAGVELARAAPLLEEYFLSHVRVSAQGSGCAGQMEPVGSNVESEGVSLIFDCGAPVAGVEIAIDTLTDIDPAYSTLATGPSGQRRSYSQSQQAFTWELGSTSSGSAGRNSAWQLGSVAVGGALLGAGWWRLRKRNRPRTRAEFNTDSSDGGSP